ncbi:hypothetical protein FNV43_RR24660 [Rhamnella rubrinervis]|uniref:Uncharacterized protein n=1 Tax=Rhamnella rubrinervis TaxID=2594499 RepID=A0A8K0GQX0_9ROSA|nr:hypothetical protein FNV43_RR24660 [Rhamnella rubrinervis]
MELTEEQNKQTTYSRQPPKKTRDDDDQHAKAKPHATQREDSFLKLFRDFALTVGKRFPREATTRHTAEQGCIQESVRLSTKQRAHGKLVEEEPSNGKEPKQRERRRSEKRRRASITRPQEDLRYHLNRKAASRNLHQEVSSSYHSPPEEEEDLRDLIRN